jgi:ribA/ribD-fused uncharacterized protein
VECGGGDGETESSVFFISSSLDYGFLSNFYPCEFIDDKELNNTKQQIVFKNMEQYFIYQKAKMFDKTKIKQILTETEPKIIQGYGRQIDNFNQNEWDKHKLGIMYRGLELKFGQNPAILDKLLKTENKTLYEANKHDRYWGIGFDVENGIKKEQDRHSEEFGKNKLGELLMKLRDSLLINNTNNSQYYRSL